MTKSIPIQATFTYEEDEGLWYADATNNQGCHAFGGTLEEAAIAFVRALIAHADAGNHPKE